MLWCRQRLNPHFFKSSFFGGIAGYAAHVYYSPAMLIIRILEILTVRDYMFRYYFYKHKVKMIYARRLKNWGVFEFLTTTLKGNLSFSLLFVKKYYW
jgi:hypothetical protein